MLLFNLVITFHIFTLFPEVFEKYFNVSVFKRAIKKKIISVKTHDIRDFSKDKHKTVDDSPYGGGAGMVLMAEPVIKAVSEVFKNKNRRKIKIVILSAKGKQFDQKTAYSWSRRFDEIFLVCGRYEGIDERVRLALRAEEISVGPYVLTDGDSAATVLVSAISRLAPGFIKTESLKEESHWGKIIKNEKAGVLEYPHYTRPDIFEHKGRKFRVPKILLSGNHKKIQDWRFKKRK